jgi:hypothetical protein
MKNRQQQKVCRSYIVNFWFPILDTDIIGEMMQTLEGPKPIPKRETEPLRGRLPLGMSSHGDLDLSPNGIEHYDSCGHFAPHAPVEI